MKPFWKFVFSETFFNVSFDIIGDHLLIKQTHNILLLSTSFELHYTKPVMLLPIPFSLVCHPALHTQSNVVFANVPFDFHVQIDRVCSQVTVMCI